MVFSIKQAVKLLEELCTAHKQINTYLHGDIVKKYKKNEIVHTTVISAFTNAIINPTDITVTMTLACLDQVETEGKTDLDIESNTLQILGDLINFIDSNNDTWKYARTTGTPSAVKVVEKQMDVVNGWSATVQLRLIKDNGICNIPMTGIIPTPPATCEPATITVNADDFATVISGGSLDVLVKYVNGTSVGTIVGGTVLIPNPVIAEDAILNVNGVYVVNIGSGLTYDLGVKNGGQNNIGAYNVEGFGNWDVGNSDIKINGVSVASVWAEATELLYVKNGNGLQVGSLIGGEWIVPTATTDIFLKFHWDAANDTTDTATIDADSAGVYTSITDDGSSGTITVSVNGGAYVDFSTLNPLTLVNTDTIAFKRTITTGAGFVKTTGTY